jgi:hypothetical protein
MGQRKRDVMRRLRTIALQASVYGGVGLVAGVILGVAVGAPALFVVLAGASGGVIGVWYVAEVKER